MKSKTIYGSLMAFVFAMFISSAVSAQSVSYVGEADIYGTAVGDFFDVVVDVRAVGQDFFIASGSFLHGEALTRPTHVGYTFITVDGVEAYRGQVILYPDGTGVVRCSATGFPRN